MVKRTFIQDPLQAQKSHQDTVEAFLHPYRSKRLEGIKHPVFDFLFSYYAFPYKRLGTWSAGMDAWVAHDDRLEIVKGYPQWLRREGDVFCVDPMRFSRSRLEGLAWTIKLFAHMASSPPQYKCYGLHEWAMVYKSPQRRHLQVPLRLSQKGIDEVVESEKSLVYAL